MNDKNQDQRPLPGVWINPDRQGGAACFDGTRVTIDILFDYLPEPGLEEFMNQYPTVHRPDVEAVLRIIEQLRLTADERRDLETMLSSRIVYDTNVRSGKVTLGGMRITVQDVLSYLATGMNIEELLLEFPYLDRADALAALAFADELLSAQ